MVLLATFTTGLVFTKQSKQGSKPMFRPQLHILLNIFACNLHSITHSCETINVKFWTKHRVATPFSITR